MDRPDDPPGRPSGRDRRRAARPRWSPASVLFLVARAVRRRADDPPADARRRRRARAVDRAGGDGRAGAVGPAGRRSAGRCCRSCPATLRDLAARPVTAGPEQNAAYGDPPLTVACGVPGRRSAPADGDQVCCRWTAVLLARRTDAGRRRHRARLHASTARCRCRSTVPARVRRAGASGSPSLRPSASAGRPDRRLRRRRRRCAAGLRLAQCRPVPRRRAVRIRRSTSFGYSRPVAAHIRGNIDVGVKPGIVLISLR